jgi:hypothetical protein
LAALVEMAFARNGDAMLGLHVEFEDAEPWRLFGEAPGYVMAVRPADADALVRMCTIHGVAARRTGTVLAAPDLELAIGGARCDRVALADLARGWRHGLRRVFDEERPA